jgi:hypothetical protein
MPRATNCIWSALRQLLAARDAGFDQRLDTLLFPRAFVPRKSGALP